MGLGNISLWQLLILLLIVVLLFGTKRVRNLGSDLSSAIRDFRKGLSEGEEDKASEHIEADRPEESSAESARENEKSESR